MAKDISRNNLFDWYYDLLDSLGYTASAGSDIRGTSGDDVLDGTAGEDEIDGLGGNDILSGLGGDDEMDGGSGDDVVDGGDGNDDLNGGSGNDTVIGGEGDDDVDGGSGDDIVNGGDGNDTVDGGSGDDTIDAGAGNDVVDGASGHDFIDAGAGDDVVEGGSGHDVIIGGAGNDDLAGDSGDDILEGGEGDDVIDGGKFGTDGARYAGSIFDFDFQTLPGGLIQVTDTNAADGDEGVDVLGRIDYIEFNNFTLQLDGSNHAPLINTVDQSASEDDNAASPGTFSVEAVDFDGDGLSVVGTPTVTGGILTLDSTTPFTPGLGTGLLLDFSFDANGEFEHLSAGDSATVVATVTVEDSTGLQSTQSFNIVVDGVNDAPVAADLTVNTDEDQGTIQIDLNALISDVDANDIVSVSGVTQAGDPVVFGVSGGIVEIDTTQFNALPDGGGASFVLTYTADDGNGGTDTGDVTVNVAGINDAPVAMDFVGNTDEDQGIIQIDLNNLVSDVDAGDVVSVTGVTTSGDPVVISVNDGIVTIDTSQFNALSAGEQASFDIDFTAVDLLGATDTGTFTVNVAGVNDAPVAADDTVDTNEDAGIIQIDLNLLVSDVDANDIVSVTGVTDSGDPVSYSVSGGVVTLDTGQFTALSAGDTASFVLTYTADDGNGGTDTGDVTVNVAGINDAPVAADATVDTNEDAGIVQIDLNALVSDADINDIVTITASSGAPVVFSVVNGVVSIDTAQFDSLAGGESDSFDIAYTANDGNGGIDTGTVTVNVAGVNDAPVAADDTVNVTEDSGTVTIDLNALVSDVDAGDIVGVTGVVAGGEAVTLSVSNGVVTFDAGQFNSLALGESTVFTLTYTADDGNGGTDTGVVTVNVAGQNDAPAFTFDPNGGPFAPALIDQLDVVVNEASGNPIVVDLKPLFDDPDATDTLSFSLISIQENGAPRPIQVPFNIVNGVLTIDPVDFGLADGETFVGQVSVLADDGSGAPNATLAGSFDLTVIGAGDDTTPPNANTKPEAKDAQLAFDDEGLIQIDLNGLISDADAGQVPVVTNVTFLSDGRSAPVVFTIAAGVITIDPAQFNLPDGAVRNLSFNYTVDDGSGAVNATDTGTVNFTVTGVPDSNLPPVAADTTLNVNEDAGIISVDPALLGLISDPDAGDTPTVVSFTLGSESGLVVDVPVTVVNGVASFDTGLFGVATGEVLPVFLTYTVDDGSGAPNSTDEGTVTVNITGIAGVNTAPVAQDDTLAVNEADGTVVIDLNAYVADNDGDTLTVTSAQILIGGVPSGITVNLVGNQASFDPADFGLDNGQAQTATLQFVVDDNTGAANATDTGEITLNVTGSGGAGNTQPNAGNANVLYDLDVDTGLITIDLAALVVDPDGDYDPTFTVNSFSFPSEEGTVNVVFTQTDGIITVDPAQFALGEGALVNATLNYTVDDGSGAANNLDSGIVSLTVTNPDDGGDGDLDFEDIAPANVASVDLVETDIYEGFNFAGTAAVFNVENLPPQTDPRALQGIDSGQTTAGGKGVIVGSAGDEVRTILVDDASTAEPNDKLQVQQTVESDFALYDADSPLRIEGSFVLDNFSVAQGNPFPFGGGFNPLGDAFDLQSLSLNVVGNDGENNNAPVSGDMVFYTVGATELVDANGNYAGYAYDLYAIDAFEFTADPDDGPELFMGAGSATDDFADGTVAAVPAGVILESTPLVYAIGFTTDDGSPIVLDDLVFSV